VNRRYLKRAAKLALRSGCLRAKRGAVIVKDNKILVEACNTPFPSNDFCQKHGCLRDRLKLGLGRELEKTRAIHAEAKAISLAALRGVSLEGATIYITCMPCINCAKLILTAGIKKVYYLDLYSDRTGERLLKKMGVGCERVKLEGDRPEKRLRDTRGQNE